MYPSSCLTIFGVELTHGMWISIRGTVLEGLWGWKVVGAVWRHVRRVKLGRHDIGGAVRNVVVLLVLL